MADKQTAVVRIASTSGPNDNGWFEVEDGNGTKYSTKKRDIYERAASLKGKQAEITFTVQENGKYTNRYLEDATPAEAEQQGGGGGGPSPKDIGRMARFSAIQTAAILLASPKHDDPITPKGLIELTEFVLAYGFKGRDGVDLSEPEPQPEQQTETTTADDDIPF